MRRRLLHLFDRLVDATVLVDKVVDELGRPTIIQLVLGDTRRLQKLFQLFRIKIVRLIVVRLGIPANVLKVLEVGWYSNVFLLQYLLLVLVLGLFAQHIAAVHVLGGG